MMALETALFVVCHGVMTYLVTLRSVFETISSGVCCGVECVEGLTYQLHSPIGLDLELARLPPKVRYPKAATLRD